MQNQVYSQSATLDEVVSYFIYPASRFNLVYLNLKPVGLLLRLQTRFAK